MKNILCVSFFGSSGTGKSTCFKMAKEYLENKGYDVYGANVAKPLRLIQNYAHLVFGQKCQDTESADFKQDGQLLGFLAKHFEQRLGLVFLETVENIIDRARDRRIAIINTDCRNNSYDTLKGLGFYFVKVETTTEILSERRKVRGDLTPFDHNSSVEQFNKIEEMCTIRNDGTTSDLKKEIENALAKLLSQ